MLRVEHISSGYGKKQVLFDISFEIKKGEIILLTGGNGSGKSTLMKAICNLLPLWKGSIWLKDERIDNLISHEIIRKGIIYIPQKNYYFENLTVEENLIISGSILKKQELNQKISKIYELTGLSLIKNRKPFYLSGGERKLLAFGIGLMHNPSLLLFDEPFSGIDSDNSIKIKTLIKEQICTPDNSVLIIEHKEVLNDLYTRNIIMELAKVKIL